MSRVLTVLLLLLHQPVMADSVPLAAVNPLLGNRHFSELYTTSFNVTEQAPWQARLHSHPLSATTPAAARTAYDTARPALIVYGGDAGNPEFAVFTAANDGYLHAIDGASRKTLWSFNLQEKNARGGNTEKADRRFSDIVPITRDANGDGRIVAADGDFAYLLFGGHGDDRGYYLLDVTHRNNARLKWHNSDARFTATTAAPTVARIDIASAAQNESQVVLIAAGAGLVFLDLDSGEALWDSSRETRAAPAIATPVRAIDLNGDGYTDRLYATDTNGRLLRFDISNGHAGGELVSSGVIAQLGEPGAQGFYTSPDVSLYQDSQQNRAYLAIGTGSGNRYYSVRDANVFNALSQADYSVLTPLSENDLAIVGSDQSDQPANPAGWKLTLPPLQDIRTGSVTFDNTIYVVANTSDSNTLYRLNAQTGEPQSETLAYTGTAVAVQIVFPENPASNPLACSGTVCVDTGFENKPIRTRWIRGNPRE